MSATDVWRRLMNADHDRMWSRADSRRAVIHRILLQGRRDRPNLQRKARYANANDDDGSDGPLGMGGVFGLALGAFALIASEFLPVSLLTRSLRLCTSARGRPGRVFPSRARSPCSPVFSSPA